MHQRTDLATKKREPSLALSFLGESFCGKVWRALDGVQQHIALSCAS
jgi:hypothetical protein